MSKVSLRPNGNWLLRFNGHSLRALQLAFKLLQSCHQFFIIIFRHAFVSRILEGRVVICVDLLLRHHGVLLSFFCWRGVSLLFFYEIILTFVPDCFNLLNDIDHLLANWTKLLYSSRIRHAIK